MSNISNQILNLITITDILNKYGISLGTHNRTQCPIHSGKDKNFCYTDKVYHCWVCGASGNVVGLVAQIFGLNYAQAAIKINNDFGLRLSNEKPTYRERLAAQETQRHRDEEKEREEVGHEIYVQLTRIRREIYLEFGETYQVQFLDRILDRFISDPGKLCDRDIDAENLEINLKGCAAVERL